MTLSLGISKPARAARAAVAANNAKAFVYPDSAGTPSACLELVTTLATTAAPIAPPMVLMLAFMPLATPIWLDGTASTMMPDIAENARPKPVPSSAIATAKAQICECAKAIITKPGTLTAEPVMSTALAPNRAQARPEAAPKRNIAADNGSTMNPDSVMVDPNP